MHFPRRLKAVGIDVFTILLVCAVILATLLPARGAWGPIVASVAFWAVAMLFFVYGAKLDSRAVIDGISRWRLQATLLAVTFIVFPVLCLAAGWGLSFVLSPLLVTGIVFFGVLPSTVQSSIAFTSIASGNVGAAICGASLSNMVGVIATPVLAAILLGSSSVSVNGAAIGNIAVQIVLPFILGQLARPVLGKLIQRHKAITQIVDRGSILLIVYSAFSAGVVAGIWSRVSVAELFILLALSLVLLVVAILLIGALSRALGLEHGDEMVLLFCGATKSLASGIPIAATIFAPEVLSIVILPIMLYHQVQLIACSALAQRQSQRLAAPAA